jgi:peptidoglycan/xylan/chitin deacetylase (PgdA/CDA1 family)
MLHDASLPSRLVDLLHNDGFIIFLFHGVIKEQTHAVRNYTGKHIQADLFEQCIRLLSAKGNPLSMDQILELCHAKTDLPPKSFAVTFDDGFANNISVAVPILAHYGVPATFYVTTGFIENNGMSWIDRIEYAVEQAPSQALEVAWTREAFILSSPRSRIAFLQAVRTHVKNDPHCDANAFADVLCARLGVTGTIDSTDPLDLKMTWDQVRDLHARELFTIGGHSHTHAILSYLTPDQLAQELDASLTLLQENANVGPTHYSYPEGLAHCYAQQVIDELINKGVQCCPTAIDGSNKVGDDPFHLKRVMVG